MLCSMCKVNVLNVVNYDRKIWDGGVLLCRNCSKIVNSNCPLCDGQTKNKSINQTTPILYLPVEEDNESNITDLSKSEIISNEDSSFFNVNITESELIGLEKHMNDLDENIKSIQSSRSACTAEQNCELTENIDNSLDPREIFIKSLYGEMPTNFDPKHYYRKVMSELSTLDDLRKYPNFTKLNLKQNVKQEVQNISRNELNKVDIESQTVLNHLNEFRKATNYVSPDKINVYKWKDETNAIFLTSNGSDKIEEKSNSSIGQIFNSKNSIVLTDSTNTDESENSVNINKNTNKFENRDNLNLSEINKKKKESKAFGMSGVTSQMINKAPLDKSKNEKDSSLLKRLELNTSQQRSEAIRQNQNKIREKLKQEIYSNFVVKNDENCQRSTFIETALHNNKNNNLLTEQKDTISSTESYPKLNPTLSYVGPKDILDFEILNKTINNFRPSEVNENSNHDEEDKKIVTNSKEKLSEDNVFLPSNIKNVTKTDGHPNKCELSEENISNSSSTPDAQQYPPCCSNVQYVPMLNSYPPTFCHPQYLGVYGNNNHINTNINDYCWPLNYLTQNLVSVTEEQLIDETFPEINSSNISIVESLSENCENQKYVETNIIKPILQHDLSSIPNTINLLDKRIEHETPQLPGIYPANTDTNIFYNFAAPPIINHNLKNNLENILEPNLKESEKPHKVNIKENFRKCMSEIFPKLSNEDINKILKSMDGDDKQCIPSKNLQEKEVTEEIETPKSISNQSDISSVTAWRAFLAPLTSDEPEPQSKPIVPFDGFQTQFMNCPKVIKSASELNIPRNPILCPCCNKYVCVSDFCKHIKIDHVKVPVESISSGKCKNLFLDPRIEHFGINKCQMLYLVAGKICDLGSHKYKNYLPICVMSTRASIPFLLELTENSIPKITKNKEQFLMIWLTGLYADDLPLFCSFTAWSRYHNTPGSHIVHSGKVYSIREPQDVRSLYKSGQVMLLSDDQCKILTNNGTNMIELQVIVH